MPHIPYLGNRIQPVRDVLSDRPVEQDVVLRDNGDVSAQVVDVVILVGGDGEEVVAVAENHKVRRRRRRRNSGRQAGTVVTRRAAAAWKQKQRRGEDSTEYEEKMPAQRYNRHIMVRRY